MYTEHDCVLEIYTEYDAWPRFDVILSVHYKFIIYKFNGFYLTGII